MLNFIWSFLIFSGIIFASFTGNIENLGNDIISSAKDAIDLLIFMAGIVAMWNGFLTIAEDSGLVKHLSCKMKPLLHFLFPAIPKDHIANDYICANFIANILGLGWASTPTGLLAMKALKELEVGQHEASDEMCTFLVLNISSLQLIPVTIVAYRNQFGAENPSAIVVPAILATFASTMTGILYCKWKCRKRSH